MGRWRQGQELKGAGVTPEEKMVGMTEEGGEKKLSEKRSKAEALLFTGLKALKRIRDDRACSLLSSPAIRLS